MIKFHKYLLKKLHFIILFLIIIKFILKLIIIMAVIYLI